MEFAPQPPCLINRHGQVAMGVFPQSVAHINGRDADYRTPMGRPASRRARHFHYKQFQYFGVISDQLLAGCALADTGYLGIAFFYIFEPHTGRLREYTWHSPLARALTLSTSPLVGESNFHQRGVNIRMGYQNAADGPSKSLSVRLPGITLDATLDEGSAFQPMSLCTRTGINGWVYANKVAGTRVRGQLQHNSQVHDLASLDAFGHHDFSAGYMRRETFWNWACLSGRVNGSQLGLNLSCGVNETSYSENCLWLDGRIQSTGGTVFHYDRDDVMRPWQIHSRCGQVELTFTPSGQHRERLNLGLFASNFHQLFGHFHGRIRLHDGRVFAIDRLYGFVEEQYAKW